MTHTPGREHIARALQNRIDAIPSVDVNGVQRIVDFGVFIDTHRDQPHVGTFLDLRKTENYLLGEWHLRS